VAPLPTELRLLDLLRPALEPGWTAFAPDGEVLRVVHVSPGPKPSLAWTWEGAWPATTEGRRETLSELRRSRRARSQGVWVLGREQYRVVQAEPPAGLGPEQWRDALRWQLKGQVDFDVADASIDLLTIPADRRAQVLAVLSPRAPLRAVVAVLEATNWRLKAIDIPETALRNLSARLEPAGRAQALLSFGSGVGWLVVTFDGELLVQRQIDVQASALRSDDDATREAALDRVGLEVQRTLDGVDRAFSQLSLARLLVVPGPGMAALTEHLRGLTFVPVLPFDLTEAVDSSTAPQLAGAASAPWLLALGAALRP
jgi:MSHA biogenesis protein MshI